MKTTIQILLMMTLILTLIGTIAEKDKSIGSKSNSLSQQLSAICAASIIALGASFFA